MGDTGFGAPTRRVLTAVTTKRVDHDDLKTLNSIFLMTPDMTCTEHNTELLEQPIPHDIATHVRSHETQIRCVCGSTNENGKLIQCDACKYWLHQSCIQLENDDGVFVCIYCQWRLTRAIKSYAQQQMLDFIPRLQLLEREIFAGPSANINAIWNDLFGRMNEIHAVFQHVSEFLPAESSSQESSPNEAIGSSFGSEEDE